MADNPTYNDPLAYHAGGARPGKLEIRATKPMATQRDLALAYSPGVAEPSRAIAKNKLKVFDYTAKGNLVAVVSDGTAVLGLGNIGPEASKPVMEGKAVLFKRFADIDVFDLELDTSDPDAFIAVVKALEPTFGGINLEDISAPASFYIEERLKEEMGIPVFHDDQHGTAIISGAALLNAMTLTGKDIGEIRIAVSGAGAAAIACAKLWVSLGVDPKKIFMTDSRGLLTKARNIEDPYKAPYAQDTDLRTLADIMVGADVFLGLSVAGVVTPEMVASMADKPIVFALANPDPEIPYPDVKAVRPDAIVATGRSDFPNQVNNVLGFPFIFRGALDVRAKAITEEMKIAAVRAIAALSQEPVPASVSRAYGDRSFRFGPDYIIPTPFDPRVLVWVAPAVARAAIESGVALKPIEDWDAYSVRLERMMDRGRGLVRVMHDMARHHRKRIVFPEGDEPRVLQAASILANEGIAQPVLIGRPSEIEATAAELEVSLDGVELILPRASPRLDDYVSRYLEERKRRGLTQMRARREMLSRTVFGLMMVRESDADGIVLGATRGYADAIRPVFQLVGAQDMVCGLHVVLTQNQTLVFADTTVHIDPTAEELVGITDKAIRCARTFGLTPRVAMISFANFGAVADASCAKMAKATELVRMAHPDVMVEGEIQIDTALDMDLRDRLFPWSRLDAPANVLIFPNLAAANASYKLMHQLGGASIFGPILMGTRRPVSIMALNADPNDIVNLAAWTAVSAQGQGVQVQTGAIDE